MIAIRLRRTGSSAAVSSRPSFAIRLLPVFCALTLATLPSHLIGAQFYNDWAASRFSDVPAQSGPLADPDQDGQANLFEFAFGTDPRVADSTAQLVFPLSGGVSGANVEFDVQILERAGHQSGAQIDLYLSPDLKHWLRPWWLRVTTNSLASDPSGSVREQFTTRLSGTNAWFVRSAVRLLDPGPVTAHYYVATNGSDSNAGTNIALPFATLAKAASLANPGDLIYVRGGTYSWTAKISLSRAGTPAQPIRIRAYPGENPIFDFSGEALGTDAMSVSSNCWQLYGLEFANAGHNAIKVTGNSNVFERCVFRGSRNTGFNIGSSSVGSLPSYNFILNCDAYRNYDPDGHGGNADGFAAKWNIGPGNVFSGCRSWENSDDGWDLWMGISPVLITNCWTFRNGSNYFGDTAFAGNGNGFKLGGNFVPAAHRLVGCIAFNNVGNGGNGIDQNNNTAGLNVDQNSTWANRNLDVYLDHGTVTQGVHTVRNNVSLSHTYAIQSGSVQTSNTWQVLPAVATSDFLSVDVSFALASRQDDGSLPETPFLRPVPGGNLVDKGANLGAPFSGSAPDLGAVESQVW
jgi:hypothetical protein